MNTPNRNQLLAAWSGALLSSLGLTGCETPAQQSAPTACAEPVPFTIDGHDTGIVTCPGTTFRARETRVTCPDLRDFGATFGGDGDPSAECTSHADCDQHPYGFCDSSLGTYCVDGCVNDDQCPDGSICDCGDPIGRCVPADCATGDDCADGGRCARYDASGGCEELRYACQTAQDECASDSDCGGRRCVVGERGFWECQPLGCDIGRPFLVHGEERLASLELRSDWLAQVGDLDVATIPERLRGELAAHWVRVGLMEHASVAAFARFALQLLHLGAPPDLLRQCHAAMSDETEHATLCFALAAAYNGIDRGPGALELDGAFDVQDLIGILELVIEEGCIGETTAALEAAESAQLAADPVVAAVLTRIAADEQRHAELAWATLKWALEAGGADTRVALRQAFERTLEHASRRTASPASPDEAELLRHGVFSDRLRDGVRRDVIDAVVAPTFAALWASVDGADAVAG